ncbi:hypothetical protein [Sphingomonas koreensis]
MLVPGLAAAQSVAPSAAPAAWVRYAEASTSTISAWLQEDGEAPARLRACLDEARIDRGGPIEIQISLWLKPDGRIERLRFPALAHAQANAELQNAILNRNLGTPPQGMLLPMRIAVQLELAGAD